LSFHDGGELGHFWPIPWRGAPPLFPWREPAYCADPEIPSVLGDPGALLTTFSVAPWLPVTFGAKVTWRPSKIFAASRHA
jgi:hypothetical protein